MDILFYDVIIYECIKTSSCILQIQKTFICQLYHNKAEKKKSSQAFCIMNILKKALQGEDKWYQMETWWTPEMLNI